MKDLTQAHIEGVDTIVEVSPLDLGREVSLMKEVSEQSGVQFICCTGCWLDIPVVSGVGHLSSSRSFGHGR